MENSTPSFVIAHKKFIRACRRAERLAFAAGQDTSSISCEWYGRSSDDLISALEAIPVRNSNHMMNLNAAIAVVKDRKLQAKLAMRAHGFPITVNAGLVRQ